MNYRSMRRKKRLSAYTVAQELGIDKKKYLEVEDGYRQLEGDFINKFMDILDRSEDLKIARMQKLSDIEEWIQNGQVLIDLAEMGYNQVELAEILGVKQPTISMLIHGKSHSDSYDLKEEVYDFLHNPMNKKIVKDDQNPQEDKIVNKLLQESVDNIVISDESSVLTNPLNENGIQVSNPRLLELESEIKELKRRIYLYEKLIEKL